MNEIERLANELIKSTNAVKDQCDFLLKQMKNPCATCLEGHRICPSCLEDE